jgi:hypothetical protein
MSQFADIEFLSPASWGSWPERPRYDAVAFAERTSGKPPLAGTHRPADDATLARITLPLQTC